MDDIPANSISASTAGVGVAEHLMELQAGAGNAEASPAAPAAPESSNAASVLLPPSYEAAQDLVASGGLPSDASAEQVKDPILETFEAQYAAVKGDPRDFNKLVALISAAEKLGDIGKLREVYGAFFAEYPLCFGYWKKFADAENRHGSPDAAVAVYERGVAAIPYSVDLWGHYASFKQTLGANSEEVQSVFERGLNLVGGDYAAYGLWSKYINFTAGHGGPYAAAQIYRRALGQPLKDLDKCFNSLKDFVSQREVSSVVPQEDRAGLEAQVKARKEAAFAAQQKTAEEAEAAARAAAQEAAEQAAAAAASLEAPVAPKALDGPSTPGAERITSAEEMPAAAPQTPPPTASGAPQDAASEADQAVTPPPASAPAAAPAHMQESAADHSTAMPNGDADAAVAAESALAKEPAVLDTSVTDDDVKEAFVAGFQAKYEASKEEVGRRKVFEDAIKRPYFHVKALDGAQLTAWSRFLDYAEEHGNSTVSTHLYERCLVACAQYHEFWARYIRFLEPGSPDGAKDAMRRAQGIHCKTQPEMQLLAARFHERHGDAAAARAAYELVTAKLAPGLVSAVLAFANFERRQGNKAAACRIYDEAVAAAGDKGSSGEKTYAFLVVSYAHFLMQSYKDADAARSLYASALQKAPGSLSLWEGAIHLEESLDAPGEEKARKALALYAKAAGSNAVLSEAEREDFSVRAAVAADLYGTAQMVEMAERLHCARFRPTEKLTRPPSGSSRPSSGQKRPADASAAGTSPASKQARPAEYPATAASAAYPAASYAPAGAEAPAATAAAPAAVPAAVPAAAAYYGQPAYSYPGYYAPYPQQAYPTYSYPQY